MMPATEILNEIYRLPPDERKKVKQTLLEENDTGNQNAPKVTQNEFDRMLFEDGLLVNFPIEADDLNNEITQWEQASDEDFSEFEKSS
jgi:hypothetical protein